MPGTQKSPKGIGVDVVALSRMKDFWKRHSASLSKILTSEERRAVEKDPDPPRRLAYFFSAKEAVFKSLDLEWLGIEGFRMIKISIPSDEEKLAQARLSGKMKARVGKRLREWRLQFLEADGFVIAQAMSF